MEGEGLGGEEKEEGEEYWVMGCVDGPLDYVFWADG